MKAPRFQFYLGAVEAACGDSKSARKRWAKVAKANEDPSSANFAFSALAAAQLSESQGKARLEADAAAIAKLLPSAAPESRGLLLYSQGLLLHALGQEERALASFEEGSKAPNRQQSQYLNLLSLREAQ